MCLNVHYDLIRARGDAPSENDDLALFSEITFGNHYSPDVLRSTAARPIDQPPIHWHPKQNPGSLAG